MHISKLYFDYNQQSYYIDTQVPIDISIVLKNGADNPNCYYADTPCFETIETDSFVGSVAKGGSCNYQKITITPHGNGTHTECFGHISADSQATLDNCLQQFWFSAYVVSLEPKSFENDQVISLADFLSKMPENTPEAIIVRTLPNDKDKLNRKYSATNPPYLEASIGKWLAENNVKHFLVDLPSVDREEDGGMLSFHKNFWQYPHPVRKECTITEMVFVPNVINDGLYLLNLQVANLQIDASPSRPVLYEACKV